MSPFLVRAQMLIQQSRFELAETELRQALATDPDDAYAHALLAICLVEMEKFNEATDAANTTLELAPDSPFSYYVASKVSDARNQLKKAEEEIRLAIAMDHTNPAYFAQLANVSMQQKKWQVGLEAAETGLEMDPEDVLCTNLRAIAMVKLGRNSEAGTAIQSALEKSPEDAYSHANMGWSLLEKGQPKNAMPHFREALRLEPNMEWARSGIIESMKSQYFIYRMLLGWFLWASKLDSRTLMMILIGGYVGANVASQVAAQNPALRPVLLPLIVAYLAFVILTWIAVPMFNLLLRFNKFGRMVLSDEEKRISTLVGTCLVIAIFCIVIAFATGHIVFLVPAFAAGLLTPIIGTYYQSDPGWPRAVHGLLVLTMTVFGIIITTCAIAGVYSSDGAQLAFHGLVNISLTPLIVFGVGSQFAVNFLAMAKPMRGTRKAQAVWLIGGSALAMATLGVLAFIAYAVYVIENDEQVNYGPAIRASFFETEELNWGHPDQLRKSTSELRKLGFEEGGDFTCLESPELRVRFLLHANGWIVAELFEHSILGKVHCSMSVLFEDGNIVKFTDSDEEQILPPSLDLRVVAMSPKEMFYEIREEMKRGPAREFKIDELASVAEEEYAVINDFLLNRGGRTDQEVLQQAESIGISLSPRELNRYQKRWKRDVAEKIDQFVVAEFVKSNPKFADDRSKLQCLNRYTLTSDKELISVLALIPSRKRNDLDKITELVESEPTTFRAKIFELIDPDKAARVGQTQVPVPTDIYLIK